MASSLPRTFRARPSNIGIYIGVLFAVSAVFFGLGVSLGSARMMIRAGGGLVVAGTFLAFWLVKRIKSVTVEPGAVLLDARRFSAAGARITTLEDRVLGGRTRRAFWMALPDGSGGEVNRGFTNMIWPEIDELYAALQAAGVKVGMPYPR